MGREVMRVPLNFDFPIGKSYADWHYDQHLASCSWTREMHNEDECPNSVYWRGQIPTGDGWQLWQTVSDGPVSPVFATPEELIDWMSQPDTRPREWWQDQSPYPKRPWGQGWRRETAEKFVRGTGWIPSLVVKDGNVQTTDEVVSHMSEKPT